MFKKPFKLKFQVQLKSTEKKKFSTDLKTFFPALQDEDISSLLGSKEMIVRTRVVVFKEDDVDIYCINKVPLYFEIIDTDIKLPTVFMIWKFPHMLPSFTTSNSVFSRLRNGADLFFPGVCKQGLLSHLDYKKKDPVYVNLIDNKAAMAVGLSLVNKEDIINENKNKDIGGVVRVYHTSGDFLFKMNSDAVVLELGPPDWALPVKEEPQVGKESETNQNAENVDVIELAEEIDDCKLETKETDGSSEAENSELEKEKNNELLEFCFLKALKTIPKNSYPILPATFYANHVLTNLPEGENLHIKKTKWKKFSTFLQEKSLQGLIQLDKRGKNEFTISGANLDHNQLKEFVDPHKVVKVEPKSLSAPVVMQVFLVSAKSLPFFSKFGLKKDDELTRNDVRNYLNEYIKRENLVHPEKPEFVLLDPILNTILNFKEIISRANLLGEILESMKTQHKVSTSGNTDVMVYKCKLPLIEFQTCLRTGNKKVTLISNLESYGVDVRNFSKELQHKAAASTTITPFVPGKKGPQVQVQGNQIANAVAILKEKYNINEQLMKGLEKAVKPKTKK